MPRAVLGFEGSFDIASFQSFCFARARLLALDLRIVHREADRLTVCVSGNDVLIDMFEVAAGLGPAGAVVDQVTRFSYPQAQAV
ncbi:MAG: hypothetical protein AAF739_07165 [Pseudomonadota bacterium]